MPGNNVHQIFSLGSLEQCRTLLDSSPLLGLEVNPEAKNGGSWRYLVLSSFNQQFILACEGFEPAVFSTLAAILQNHWLVTAAPAQLSRFLPAPLQPLNPRLIDQLLPWKLVTCGQDHPVVPAPRLPKNCDELAHICRLAYHYLETFCQFMPLVEEGGLKPIFEVECALGPVLTAISSHGMLFDRDKWQQNQQAVLPAAENDKWQTAIGLVARDILPNIAGDGRLHSHYEPLGAATGRLSSNNPNLQSIPAHDLVRQCFIAPPDYAVISADYSGAELRILAQLSKEPLFLEAFANQVDFHSYIAQKVFGQPVSKDEHPELRKQAKIINFGLAYGMGPGGLAKAAAITLPQANKLLAQYKETLPVLFKYLEENARQAIQAGFATTIMGRRRYLQGLEANEAERVARNTPIQGSCADIIKIALIRLHSRLTTTMPDAHIINTVHDEIVIEAPLSQAQQVADLAKMEMGAAAGAVLADVPMEAEVTISHYWQH